MKIKIVNWCFTCGGQTHGLIYINGKSYWYCLNCGKLTEVEVEND